MAEEKDPRIITPMPQALVDRIDDYRFRERIPSRAEAIRRLVEKGLLTPDADAHQDKQPKRQSMAELDAELAAEAPRRIRQALNLDD